METLTLKAKLLMEQGNIEEAVSNYQEASVYYTQSFEIFAQQNHIQGMIEVRLKLGVIYRKQGIYNNAQEELLSCLHLSKTSDLSLLHADASIELVIVHEAKGAYQEELKEKESESEHSEALPVAMHQAP